MSKNNISKDVFTFQGHHNVVSQVLQQQCLWRRRIPPEGVKGPVGQLGSWAEIGGGWMDSRIESPAYLSAGFRTKVCQHFCLIMGYAG